MMEAVLCILIIGGFFVVRAVLATVFFVATLALTLIGTNKGSVSAGVMGSVAPVTSSASAPAASAPAAATGAASAPAVPK